MENLLFLILGTIPGLLLGFFLGFLFSRMKWKILLAESQSEWSQKAIQAQSETEAAKEQMNTLRESQSYVLDELKKQFENEKRTLIEHQKEEKDAIQTLHENARAEMERQWKEKMGVMKTEFENLTNRYLKEQQKNMQECNQESVGKLLLPLGEKILNFTTQFDAHKKQQIVLQTSVETAIKGLLSQTAKIGEDAENLTKALKADPKKQGDWGEAVLRNILEASGLTEGRDFFVQEGEIDENDCLRIPDVKILLPKQPDEEEPSYIIIDSKVSIRDYLGYMQSENEDERKRFLKKHIDSVRKHYKELSEKNYAKNVRNTVGYVLMFIPNEGSFLLALENDPSIALDAYRNHIIIINPTNLMLSLNIIRLLWQSQRQTDNVRSIIESANRIYDKFATISQNFESLGNYLKNAQKAYAAMQTQFCAGKGNLIRQFETWKELGIPTTKQIARSLIPKDSDDSSDDA